MPVYRLKPMSDAHPLEQVATAMAADFSLLCLDELQVKP
jgi:predicted ATPase